jgi:hypothetical protein
MEHMAGTCPLLPGAQTQLLNVVVRGPPAITRDPTGRAAPGRRALTRATSRARAAAFLRARAQIVDAPWRTPRYTLLSHEFERSGHRR